MKFNGMTGKFEMDAGEIERARNQFLRALRKFRLSMNLPMDAYKIRGPLTDADHAQIAICDAAKEVGITFLTGMQFPNDLDLREPGELGELSGGGGDG